jgi:hypothetical protein
MKSFAAIALCLCLCLCLLPRVSRAGALNLATLTCEKYENEVLPAAVTNPAADSINTVMWLFGYSVARSRAHVLYPDALTPFGYALDDECKSNPRESMLDALSIVKPESKNPMDIANLECETFAPRHVELARTDAESANTIMMWLFGFSVARSGSHIFDADALNSFQTKLLDYCTKHPKVSLLDALSPVKGDAPTAVKPR